MSFSWNKESQLIITDNFAKFNHHRGLGPLSALLILATRFVAATGIWIALFPHSRRRWSWRTVTGGLVTGLLMAIGFFLQQAALLRSSEANVAFLTSLMILFVPLISIIIHKRRLSGRLIGSAAISIVGIAMMTHPFGSATHPLGTIAGIAAAAVLAGHVISIEVFGVTENAFRFTLSQFAFCSIFLLFASAIGIASTRESFKAVELMKILVQPRLFMDLVLLVLGATVIADGLSFRFQPHLSPSQATIIYSLEAPFAAMYAWVAQRQALLPLEVIGGTLVLAANLFMCVTLKGGYVGDTVRRCAADGSENDCANLD